MPDDFLNPDSASKNLPAVSSPRGGVDVGEYLSVDGGEQDGLQITDAEDGGAFIDFPGHRDESAPPDEGFYSNLAEVLDTRAQSDIVVDLMAKIEDDKEARKKRDEQYAEGIRRTGLGDDAPGGAEFQGASRVVHPMMIEATIDYESRIIKEIWPPSGPVKPHLVGEATAEKAARATRVAAHMNHQLTMQITEARAVLEETLTQVPLGGSQFIRQWWDHRLSRPRWKFAAIDEVHVPYGAASAASAHRITYAEKITEIEFKQRIESGLYRPIDLGAVSMMPEDTKTQAANQKVEGLEDPGTNIDGIREVYETLVVLELSDIVAEQIGGNEEPGQLYPFLVHIDVQSKEMLGFYRAWEDGDPAREPISYLFEIPFIPWRGAMSIGFPQIIGGLSAAATGALRALLDSAHINNASGGFILKGAGAGGQTRVGQVGEFTEIDGGLETDDIRKRVLPFATNQPSSVLMQLLGFLVDAASGVVRTSLDEGPNQGATPVPVGTQMSRVEEGLVVFSAIHGRAHDAFNRILRGLYRLNRLYMPEYLKVDGSGKEIMVARADYEGPCAVMPVSDPTIYSDQQRWAQLNYIQSRMMVNPALWKQREVELAGLKLIKWPDPETLLNDQPQPQELNAVNENMALATGQPVRAFPEQDHLAHLHTLFAFMQSPSLGMNPLIAPIFLGPALKHAAEHIMFLYVSETVKTVEITSKTDVSNLMSNDEDVKRDLDELLAVASDSVVPAVQVQLQMYMGLMQQAMQAAQQYAPKPPMDPAMAAVMAAKAETDRKSAADQAGHALDTATAQQDATQAQQELALKYKQLDVQADAANLQSQTKLETTRANNQTALDMNATKILAPKPGASFSDGASMTGK